MAQDVPSRGWGLGLKANPKTCRHTFWFLWPLYERRHFPLW
jgi:hypothetical protein